MNARHVSLRSWQPARRGSSMMMMIILCEYWDDEPPPPSPSEGPKSLNKSHEKDFHSHSRGDHGAEREGAREKRTVDQQMIKREERGDTVRSKLQPGPLPLPPLENSSSKDCWCWCGCWQHRRSSRSADHCDRGHCPERLGQWNHLCSQILFQHQPHCFQ
jgi:hypothetical protein